ncbi:hypothetical protein L211DRAFT_682026 [Terfezia boudieri ATCC MYA-4762]|uniref:Uncharacterized protein n=1 Tax=Terfezia boudieri ATCC MYA-4762 TaxID=1051890 RepID=A0A3N4LUE3_9PEZI|nr:hypothetical protein L211DRAFT_682026 [Terfezia boudieri ATCC MYA-4762]
MHGPTAVAMATVDTQRPRDQNCCPHCICSGTYNYNDHYNMSTGSPRQPHPSNYRSHPCSRPLCAVCKKTGPGDASCGDHPPNTQSSNLPVLNSQSPNNSQTQQAFTTGGTAHQNPAFLQSSTNIDPSSFI